MMNDLATLMLWDFARAGLMFMGGMAIAMKWPVLRYHLETLHWFRRGRLRFDDVGIPLALRSIAHTCALLFIIAELAFRLGSEPSWRMAAAGVVFALTIAGLVSTHRRDKAARTAVRQDKAHEPGRPRNITR